MYPKQSNREYSATTIRMHVEAILLPRNLLERCCSLDSTGPLFSRMPIPCAGNETNAKGWGRCLAVTFPSSLRYIYILVGVDYVSKWVKAVPCRAVDHRVVLKFLKENIFFKFGVPKAIICDGGSHFCNKPFETLLTKYGVKHKVATPYHP